MGRSLSVLWMIMGGLINCRRCGSAFVTLFEIGKQMTDGELCVTCSRMENPEPDADPIVKPSPTWGIAPPAVSAHDALEDLLNEVWKDEANWSLDDKIDLALGIHRAEPKKGKA